MRRWGAMAGVLVAVLAASTAEAGMGTRGAAPKWRPEPCQGDACKGDDPRSGLPCQGLLCTFSSAKSLQPPLTASEADVQRRAAEARQSASAEPVAPSADTIKAAPARSKKAGRPRTSRSPDKGKAPTSPTQAADAGMAASAAKK